MKIPTIKFELTGVEEVIEKLEYVESLLDEAKETLASINDDGMEVVEKTDD